MKPRLFLSSSIDEVAGKVKERWIRILKTSNIKLAYITTACEVEEDRSYINIAKTTLENLGISIFDYTLTGKTSKEIEKDLKEADVIHLHGGNTFYLMQQIRLSGFDRLIKQYLKKGKIYSGSSAGSIVAGPTLELEKYYDDPRKAPRLKSFKGMGLVDFVIYPHWGNPYFRKDFMKKENLELFYNFKGKIILLSDNQFVETDGETIRLFDNS